MREHQKFEVIKDVSEIISWVRPVNEVFIHCSASDNPEHDRAEVIEQWHRARGFKQIGYHFFIHKDGTIQKGRSLEKMPAAQQGHNIATIAICVHGLVVDKFTHAQQAALIDLCMRLNKICNYSLRFRGHCEVDKHKTCPVFDYRRWLKLDARGMMTIHT